MVDITIAGTVATMSTESGQFGRKSIAIGATGIGLLLFFLAALRVQAYSHLLDVPMSVDRDLASGKIMTEAVLLDARESYRMSIAAMPGDADLQRTYGRLELRQSKLHADSPEQLGGDLSSAAEHFRAAISAAPSQAMNWSLLTYVRSEMSAPSSEMNDLLRMSYYAGPHEGSSILLRARAASRMWDSLDDDVRSFSKADLKEMWRYRELRPTLVEIYLDSNLATRMQIREIVIDSEVSAKIFKSLLMKAVSVVPPG